MSNDGIRNLNLDRPKSGDYGRQSPDFDIMIMIKSLNNKVSLAIAYMYCLQVNYT